MRFKELDTVLLDSDLPEHGLQRGDQVAVVEVYGSKALEVEFVTASGRTQAPVTLMAHDLRSIMDEDLIAVRTLVHGAA